MGLPSVVKKFFVEYWLVVFALISAVLLISLTSLDYVYWSEQTIGADGNVREIKLDRSKTVQQFVLLVLGPIGLALAGWRSWTAYRQADAAHKQIAISEKAQNVDRYIKSAQLLESTMGSVRRAGLYSLAELALVDKDRYYVLAMRTICGFARDTSAASEKAGDKMSPEDLIAALQIIDRIRMTVENARELEEGFLLNLSRLKLKGRNQGELRLFNISIFGGEFELAHFRKVDFSNSVFEQTTFKNGSFNSCNLTGAKFIKCTFQNWSLKDSDISGSDFSKTKELSSEFFALTSALTSKPPKLENGVSFSNFRD
jgi:hypothetical protein